MFRYYCALYKLIFLLLGLFGLCLFTQTGGLLGIILLIVCIMALVVAIAGALDGSQKKDPLQTQADNLVAIFNQTLDEIDLLQKQFKDANWQQRSELSVKKHQLYKKLCELREECQNIKECASRKNMELPQSMRRNSNYAQIRNQMAYILYPKILEAEKIVSKL